MTRPDDLPTRIAKLERLLDGLQHARLAAAPANRTSAADQGQSTLARVVDITALLQQRVACPDFDEGDAIAMRALLEEFTSIAASLRTLASDVERRLGGIGAAVDNGRSVLETLEEIE